MADNRHLDKSVPIDQNHYIFICLLLATTHSSPITSALVADNVLSYTPGEPSSVQPPAATRAGADRKGSEVSDDDDDDDDDNRTITEKQRQQLMKLYNISIMEREMKRRKDDMLTGINNS